MQRIGRRSFIKALAAGSLAAGCSRLGPRHDTDVAVLGAATLHVNGQTVAAANWATSPGNRLAENERSLPPARVESHYLAQANPLRTVAGWDGPEQSAHDESIGDVLRRLGASAEALRLVNVAGNHNHADEASALPAWRTALALREETGVGRFAGGAGALPKAMAEKLETHIRYGHAVVALQAENGGLAIRLADGTTLRARRCVCTLPTPVLRRTALDLPMADDQRRAIRDIRYTRVTVAFFDAEPFWEDDGLPRTARRRRTRP